MELVEINIDDGCASERLESGVDIVRINQVAEIELNCPAQSATSFSQHASKKMLMMAPEEGKLGARWRRTRVVTVSIFLVHVCVSEAHILSSELTPVEKIGKFESDSEVQAFVPPNILYIMSRCSAQHRTCRRRVFQVPWRQWHRFDRRSDYRNLN